MNNRFLNIFSIIASCALFTAGCSEDNSSFETPNTSDTPTNSGIVSQKNLSLLADDPQPKIFDTATGSATDTSITITAKIGDNNNQLLTDTHTIYFATEWGLVEPSCVTENGTCSVTWQTSFGPGTVPDPLFTTITAYTLGEEHFSDSNGNGVFDDNDTPFVGSADLFNDREEPYVDANRDGIFNAGDTLIDVMDGNNLGANGAHDFGDGFLNSPSCTHTSLCSTVRSTIYIWDDIELDMDGPPII